MMPSSFAYKIPFNALLTWTKPRIYLNVSKNQSRVNTNIKNRGENIRF